MPEFDDTTPFNDIPIEEMPEEELPPDDDETNEGGIELVDSESVGDDEETADIEVLGESEDVDTPESTTDGIDLEAVMQ